MGIFRRSKLTDRKPAFIDLREPATGQPAASQREVWARSNRCPRCRGVGYLDSIDVTKGLMFQHCTECSHAWQTAEADCVVLR